MEPENRTGRLPGLDGRMPLWATLALCLAILVARKPDAFYNPQFWAEDGPVFFRDAVVSGARALTFVYANYLHTLPRLVAAAASLADPRTAPAIFVGAALLFTLYTAALTQSERCPLPRHFACALAVVLIPDGFEVLLNLANLQWVTFGAFVLVLISADGTRRWQQAHDALAVALLGLTGPFSVLLAPFFLWRAWERRTRISVVLAVLCVLAAGVQAWAFWHHPPVSESKAMDLDALAAAPGARVAGALLGGVFERPDWPRTAEAALSLVTLAIVALLGLRKGAFASERRWLALAFVLLLVVSLYRCRYALPELCLPGIGARYFFPLQLLLVWLAAFALADSSGWSRRLLAAGLVWSLAVNLPRLHEPALQDMHWSLYAPQISAGQAVKVPVNPQGWNMDLPQRNTQWVRPADRLPVEARRALLLNVSSRAKVESGGAVSFGFVVGGTGTRRVLLRAIGPTLRQFGIHDVLSHPQLTVLDEEHRVLRQAAAWSGDEQIKATIAAAGAFTLRPDSADAAVLLELQPGAYSVCVNSAVASELGEVLVEVYAVE